MEGCLNYIVRTKDESMAEVVSGKLKQLVIRNVSVYNRPIVTVW